MLVILAAALALWGASAVTWAARSYQTPFTGETTVAAAGADFRPELVPVALAGLAAVAAVLATGGWFRRVIGAFVVLAAGLLMWRGIGWFAAAPPAAVPGEVPPGSTPIGELTTNPIGPVLMSAGALALAFGGVLVMLRARRMPAMGAKYSAPGAAAQQKSADPDKRLWDALDEGEDPTRDG